MSCRCKCGLPALSHVWKPRLQRQLEDGPRAPDRCLSNTIMRRMIGRYKGFRCAGMGGRQGVVVSCRCKCGLPALRWRLPRQQRQLGRAARPRLVNGAPASSR